MDVVKSSLSVYVCWPRCICWCALSTAMQDLNRCHHSSRSEPSSPVCWSATVCQPVSAGGQALQELITYVMLYMRNDILAVLVIACEMQHRWASCSSSSWLQYDVYVHKEAPWYFGFSMSLEVRFISTFTVLHHDAQDCKKFYIVN